MKYFAYISLTLALLQPLAVAHGATFRQGERVSFTAPVNDDLYAGGGMVRIDQAIAGDAVVGGGNIVVSATVRGDLLAGGGDVTVSGYIGDDARIGGGNVTITGTVNGDLVVMGGNVTLEKDAAVNGDVVVMGGNVTLIGAVGGDVWSRSGNVLLQGSVQGNVDIRGGQTTLDGRIVGRAIVASHKIDLGPKASLASGITYWRTAGKMDFGTAIKGGQVVLDPKLQTQGAKEGAAAAGGMLGFFAVAALFSAALLMGLLILGTKTFFRDAAELVRKQPWWMLLWGFLFIVATPIAAVILMITIIGIPLGIFLLVLFAFTMFFSCSLTSLVAAKWVQMHWKLSPAKWMFFLLALGAYIVFWILAFVPLVGWMVQFVAVCTALGALLKTKMARLKKMR